MVMRNKRDESFIKRLNEIIETNLKDERFGVSELASEMNMSRSTFIGGSNLQQVISQPVYKKCQVEKALELLKNESLTVAEAAYMIGFGSPPISVNASGKPSVILRVKLQIMQLMITILEDEEEVDAQRSEQKSDA